MLKPEVIPAELEAEKLQEMLAEANVQVVKLQNMAGRQTAIIKTTSFGVERLNQLYTDQIMIAKDNNLSMFNTGSPKTN